MTVVIGRRFGDAICFLSDTMISDAATGKANSIPGRLKIVTLAPLFTASYAGHANQALDAIRKARADLVSSGPNAAVETLRAATVDDHADVEFLIAQHTPTPELRRIWNGVVSGALEQGAIGDPRIMGEVERRFSQSTQSPKDYRAAFIAAFTDRKVRLGAGVGGFPITLIAAPDGHRYGWHSLSHTWKPILPTGATTYEQEEDLLTGEWSFRHDLMVTDEPGIAVLAVEVIQAKLGYVYAPLIEDDPSATSLLGHDLPYTQHQEEIHAAMRLAFDDKLREHKTKFSLTASA